MFASTDCYDFFIISIEFLTARTASTENSFWWTIFEREKQYLVIWCLIFDFAPVIVIFHPLVKTSRNGALLVQKIDINSTSISGFLPETFIKIGNKYLWLVRLKMFKVCIWYHSERLSKKWIQGPKWSKNTSKITVLI